MKLYLMVLPLVFVSVVSLGCKAKLPPGMPKLYPVTVTLTFDDGKPVDNASVKFRLTDPVLPQTWLHAGTTNSEGIVELMTEGGYRGIPAGKYSVTIEKFETEMKDVTSVAAQSDQRSGPPPMPAPGTVVPRFQLVEDIYLDHTKTPLKNIEVEEGKNNLTLTAGKEQRIYKPIRSTM